MNVAWIVVLTIAVLPTTAIELKPDRAETLARARQDVTLALHSAADVNMAETNSEQAAPKGENVKVVRYGVQSTTTTQK
jgi:pilus assembly protein CpaB